MDIPALNSAMGNIQKALQGLMEWILPTEMGLKS